MADGKIIRLEIMRTASQILKTSIPGEMQKIIDVKPESVEIVDAPIKQPFPAPPFRIYMDPASGWQFPIYLRDYRDLTLITDPAALPNESTPGLPGPQKAL